MRTLRNRLLLFLKGIGMGGADVIPGVSGGSVAFITGIYEELLQTINSFDITAIKLLYGLKFTAFAKHINLKFIFPVLSGIVIGALSLAQIISYLLSEYPIQIWSFFFGLIIISSISVFKEIHKWRFVYIIVTIIGTVFAYTTTILTPSHTPNTEIFIFMSGAIAVCAMILPGISGSFILLIFGKYAFIISALKNLQIDIILIFTSGCVVGLFAFSRLVTWFMHKFHDYAIALLAGFMLGMLNKIWPWKIAKSFRINSHGEQVPLFEVNVSPLSYFEQTGNSPYILQAILFTSLGFMTVIILEKLALAIKKTLD